ncbi:LysM peptidoglycan-binding domain-containing protein [Microcoleus sp. F4-D5]|uniref:LysM peptidoglycan-binding domain-containing protein n=1 Tax=Microcoleus sp. F4-D5 TaxID=2818760 RepID=UPI002FD22B9C
MTTYTVQSGDTLSVIAQKFYNDANLWQRIYEANRGIIGQDPDRIFPGQNLVIPGFTNASGSPRTYTVQPGDTLSVIAQNFYGDANLWQTIHEANRSVIGQDPDQIFPGQNLVIP